VSRVLSGCKVALVQGRYTYRHDNILAGIVKCIQDFVSSYSPLVSETTTIKFVKAGGKCSTRPHNLTGVLHKANDWKLSFDSVDRKLVVPPYLAISTLRPDILLISKGSKRVIMIELTLPCEENMETRHKDTLGFKALYGPLEI